jgi:hypothetical protein
MGALRTAAEIHAAPNESLSPIGESHIQPIKLTTAETDADLHVHSQICLAGKPTLTVGSPSRDRFWPGAECLLQREMS